MSDFSAGATTDFSLSVATRVADDDMRPLWQDWDVTIFKWFEVEGDQPIGNARCRSLSLRSMSADPAGTAQLLDESSDIRSGQTLGYHIADYVLKSSDRRLDRKLLILDDLVIEPKHRGRKFSLPVCRLLMSHFGSTHDLVIWDASPHHAPPSQEPVVDSAYENLRERLAAHSERTGADEHGDLAIFTRRLDDLVPPPFE